VTLLGLLVIILGYKTMIHKIQL